MTQAAGTPPGADTPGGLLAVHAHPDDETLATGALLAAWAASGQRVTVVTCSRGERGEVIDTPEHPTGLAHLEGDGPALAAHRELELAAALAALGVGDHRFLDTVHLSDAGPARANRASDGVRYEDSGMTWVSPGVAGPADDAPPTALSRVPLDDAASRLAAVLRDRRPSVVATYEPRGGYGHPDHVRAHEVTVRAVELAADPAARVPGEPWRVPERWEAVAPVSEVRAARRALADHGAVRGLADRVGLELPDPDEPLPPVAKDDAVLDGERLARVEVSPVLVPVLAAMRAHATQVQHATAAQPVAAHPPAGGLLGWYALSNDVLAPILAHETYVRRTTPVGSPR
ncbi:N-acetyl-1-D-myo-inositol-2-amino-2-deoxy-alpha-D -glucopyranoside deacetylase [Isoptericola hypogeus]|uniref:N-acetyl-1-D-myo-inositol-2-amino-2-deoxy-alpha-D -glucopyranoside deacetylase n=1 Tax=Isoptericola hypogeus TaxID=300179 RepID=A0ABN2IVU4_9MICO